MNLSLRREAQAVADTGSGLPTSVMRSLILAALVLIGLGFGAPQAHAQAWSLTKAQRQAYLNYYAPIILKRGDENSGKQGRDWITNFDFDRAWNFSTNHISQIP